MTFRSTDYALLTEDSYKDRRPGEDDVVLGDVIYRVMAHVDNPRTGFQATAYQRLETGEVVIAFRGTEFGREPVQDGIVDAGMALTGLNAQAADAQAFTQRVLAQARADAQETKRPLNVTVTGHSLGGTLAELQAHKFGLKGETFNAFGAAGLVHGVPKGSDQVINHVRAGDAVSAASAHFGEVRIYAVQQDIDTLVKAGYRDDGGAFSARNPLKATDFGAHAVDNFVPDSKTLGSSIILRENEARYSAHQSMIDRYRNDVHSARTLASAPLQTGVHAGQAVGNGVKAVGNAAGQAYIATCDSVMTGAQRAGMALDETGRKIHSGAAKAMEKLTPAKPWLGSEAAPGLLLNQSEHPGNALFKQAQAGMQAIDARYGRVSDHQTDNAAARVAVAAQSAGITCIDAMELGGSCGNRIVAAQGPLGTARSKVIDVDTVVALNTPLAQSSQAFAEALGQQQTQRLQPMNPVIQSPAGMALS